jgi:hypothetical protein
VACVNLVTLLTLLTESAIFGFPSLASKVPRMVDSVNRFVNLLNLATWIRHNSSLQDFQVHLTKSVQKLFNQTFIYFGPLTDLFSSWLKMCVSWTKASWAETNLEIITTIYYLLNLIHTGFHGKIYTLSQK